MTKWHIDRGKKVTGGKITQNRKKRKYERGSSPLLTETGKEKRRKDRVRGGSEKIRSVSAEFVNVTDLKNNKTKKVKILDVVEHPDNPHFTRRGIVTKGCVVKTELGLVRITSRPSQHGVVNGVILSEKEKS